MYLKSELDNIKKLWIEPRNSNFNSSNNRDPFTAFLLCKLGQTHSIFPLF